MMGRVVVHDEPSDANRTSDVVGAIADLLRRRTSLDDAALELVSTVASGFAAVATEVWQFTDAVPSLVAVVAPDDVGSGIAATVAPRTFESVADVGSPCTAVPIDAAGLTADQLEAARRAGVGFELGVRFGGVGGGMGVLVVHVASAPTSLQSTTLDALAVELTDFIARVSSAATLRACAESYRILFERAASTAHLADDERLHWMLEGLVLFALVTDARGDITFMNEAMLARLGRSLDEVVGRGLFDEGPEHEAVKRTVLTAIESGQLAPQWVNVLELPDATMMTVRWTSTFIRDADGQIRALASVGEDITDHVRPDDRSAEDVRMESVGRFAGGIAHDFNNFLTVIAGHTDLARSEPSLSVEVRPHLDQIDEATQRATELIRQLLAFGRQEVLAPITISVGDALEELAALLRPTFRATITIDVQRHTTDDHVKFDKCRLDQIFVNLAFNARDAMPAGGLISYTITDETLAPETAEPLGLEAGSYVVVKVADDGAGIDPAIIDHVFERYVTTKSLGEGGGLGLSTVLGVITQAGGAITIDHERAVGTEFTLYFRRSTGEFVA